MVRDTDHCGVAERELTAGTCRTPTPAPRPRLAGSPGRWPAGPTPAPRPSTASGSRWPALRPAAADDEAPDIDVYTYVPPFRTGPGGGWYKVAWGSREVLRTDRVDGAVLRFARELNRARELRFVSDDDACSAAESHRRVTGVVVSVVPALEVSVQVSPITRA